MLYPTVLCYAIFCFSFQMLYFSLAVLTCWMSIFCFSRMKTNYSNAEQTNVWTPFSASVIVSHRSIVFTAVCTLKTQSQFPVPSPPSSLFLSLSFFLSFIGHMVIQNFSFFLQSTQYISYNTPKVYSIHNHSCLFVSFLRSIVSTCMSSEIRIKVNSRIRRLLSCGQIPLQLSQDEKRHALLFLHVKIAPKKILKNSSLMPTCYRKCSSDFRDCAFVGLF